MHRIYPNLRTNASLFCKKSACILKRNALYSLDFVKLGHCPSNGKFQSQNAKENPKPKCQIRLLLTLSRARGIYVFSGIEFRKDQSFPSPKLRKKCSRPGNRSEDIGFVIGSPVRLLVIKKVIPVERQKMEIHELIIEMKLLERRLTLYEEKYGV